MRKSWINYFWCYILKMQSDRIQIFHRLIGKNYFIVAENYFLLLCNDFFIQIGNQIWMYIIEYSVTQKNSNYTSSSVSLYDTLPKSSISFWNMLKFFLWSFTSSQWEVLCKYRCSENLFFDLYLYKFLVKILWKIPVKKFIFC